MNVFWASRKDGRLRPKPEQIAQALLEIFAMKVVGDRGITLEQISSGVGFIDVGIVFGRMLHLIELKILKGRLSGVAQLAAYMKTERRRSGHLVLIDARKPNRRRQTIPARIQTPAGEITTMVIDINPIPPHSL